MTNSAGHDHSFELTRAHWRGGGSEVLQAARAALPDQRFMSAYLDYENLLDVVEEVAELGLADLEPLGDDEGCARLLGPTPPLDGDVGRRVRARNRDRCRNPAYR